MRNLQRKLEQLRRGGYVDDKTIAKIIVRDKVVSALLDDIERARKLNRLNRRYRNQRARYSLEDLK